MTESGMARTTDQVAGSRSAEADQQVKAGTRAVWASGDYHRFATELIWGLGAELVRASGISSGHDVLDVACGSGNTALRAAERGANVVACDLTQPTSPPDSRRRSVAAGPSGGWKATPRICHSRTPLSTSWFRPSGRCGLPTTSPSRTS